MNFFYKRAESCLNRFEKIFSIYFLCKHSNTYFCRRISNFRKPKPKQRPKLNTENRRDALITKTNAQWLVELLKINTGRYFRTVYTNACHYFGNDTSGGITFPRKKKTEKSSINFILDTNPVAPMQLINLSRRRDLITTQTNPTMQ